MASQFFFAEDNGTSVGSPPHGLRTTGVTQCDWKNIDDVTTSYISFPILAGQNSFTKYQYGVFSGTFNQISDVKFAHVSGLLDPNITLAYAITSGYATPATGTNASLTGDLNAIFDISTGRVMLIGSGTGAQFATGTSVTSSPAFTQYFATQLQVNSSMGPGSLASGLTLSLRFLEN